MKDEPLLDRNGNLVVVKRIPMSTGCRKFKGNKKKFTSNENPFERFADTNGSRNKCISY
jgi:hypothetical protein